MQHERAIPDCDCDGVSSNDKELMTAAAAGRGAAVTSAEAKIAAVMDAGALAVCESGKHMAAAAAIAAGTASAAAMRLEG